MMIEQVLPDLYRIEIPLPRSPLKALNSYLIKGEGRYLLIDTGQNREECKREMLTSLKKLGVDLARTDFFITHLHVDHLGLVAELRSDTSRVYFSQKEANIVNADKSAWEKRWQGRYDFYIANGFPEAELEAAIKNHPFHQYGLKQRVEFTGLREGDVLEIGEYSFRCLETPGHSPGHMCLYEPDHKVFVSGDHILFDITPNITYWPEMENSLNEYLASLDKVYNLEADIVLPGHRKAGHSLRKRIIELQAHHQARLKEVLAALEKERKTAFQIAPFITWNLNCRSWADFPPAQKWFAVGETIAHLEYLENKGAVKSTRENNRILYSLP
jgi:glyoxylase-like metal-dependent hydrolase (beta-lactamase superfamily II)